MMNRYIVLAGIIALVAMLVIPETVDALQSFTEEECLSAGFSAGNCAGIAAENSISFAGRITSIVNVFLVLASVVAMIAVIVGGVQYIIARGDENAAAQAKRTILWAVVGFIIIGLAWSIVTFTADAVRCPPSTLHCSLMPPEYVGRCPCDWGT